MSSTTNNRSSVIDTSGPRLDYAKEAPEAVKALFQLEGHVRKSKDLRAHGETEHYEPTAR